jgi:hypothetical protein
MFFSFLMDTVKELFTVTSGRTEKNQEEHNSEYHFLSLGFPGYETEAPSATALLLKIYTFIR